MFFCYKCSKQYPGVKCPKHGYLQGIDTRRVPEPAQEPTVGNVPMGGIIMWSGAVSNIPGGWALCDGTKGTPDLRDKFVIGAGNAYAEGATGGAPTHLLTAAEMPSHTHKTFTQSVSAALTPGPNGTFVYNPGTGADSGSAGSGGAHNNMPPYYALAFIQRIV